MAVYNRGRTTVNVLPATNVAIGDAVADPSFDEFDAMFAGRAVSLPPGAVVQDTIDVRVQRIAQPWWLAAPRTGALFTPPVRTTSATAITVGPNIYVPLQVADVATLVVSAPVQFREVDAVKGEMRRQVVGVPSISVRVEQPVQYMPANTDVLRDFVVTVRSADARDAEARVRLDLPRGLTADSAIRVVHLGGVDATQSATFHLRGRLPSGTHTIAAVAETDGKIFDTGYQVIDYDHIRRQRVYRGATTTISAVDMRVPATLRVAYVQGVGDNVAPALAQLGIPVTVVPASEVGRADLTPYTTVVIGPRAYEAHPELVAANAQLFGLVRRGGTMVVQYGQYEMTQPGAMPYPITLARPADRVTNENATVSMDAPADRLLQSPNRLAQGDFDSWVQERALYMPRTFDEHYRSLFTMSDPGEAPNHGAVLVTQLGQGTYIYTTLSLFRQLPAGVPGGARIFLNLLSANIAPSVNP
jgi:hypothetical protein